MASGTSARRAPSFPHQSARPQTPAATISAMATAGRICLSRSIWLAAITRQTNLELGLLHTFEADDDVHVVAHRTDHELHIIIAPLDRKTRLAAAPDFTLGSFAFAAFFKVDRDRLGHAVDRKIASDLVVVTAAFNLGALESKRRELLRVEKVRTLEMLIALVVMRVDAFHRHTDFHRAFRGISRVEGDRAVNLLELPVKIGHPEMFRAEDE